MAKQMKYGRYLHGGDYNPEQWLAMPEILEQDIEYMKEAHINEVTLGVFSWSVLEPEEGDDNISAGSNEICDYFCGTFYGCFLFRQRRSKSFVSQCNNYFFSFHWKIPLFAVHRF